jgi:hypothetical protein
VHVAVIRGSSTVEPKPAPNQHACERSRSTVQLLDTEGQTVFRALGSHVRGSMIVLNFHASGGIGCIASWVKGM